MKILVAEDDTISGICLQSQLERFGHQVLGVARDGLQAIELARVLRPELVIMDVSLPKVQGIEAAREITSERKVPIIFLSGYSLDDLRAKTKEFSNCTCLVKPISSHDLQASIESIYRASESSSDVQI